MTATSAPRELHWSGVGYEKTIFTKRVMSGCMKRMEFEMTPRVLMQDSGAK